MKHTLASVIYDWMTYPRLRKDIQNSISFKAKFEDDKIIVDNYIVARKYYDTFIVIIDADASKRDTSIYMRRLLKLIRDYAQVYANGYIELPQCGLHLTTPEELLGELYTNAYQVVQKIEKHRSIKHIKETSLRAVSITKIARAIQAEKCPAAFINYERVFEKLNEQAFGKAISLAYSY